ncbi:hypothetical protein TTHT_1939 [Thermotomaculum hydrothermale]|uniref:Tetratricopeptide repeat protein n=1 Tax=Thermotomaculum hydrothermale TaxID=981385 RepID=A0A7R6T038_9BACT|nr:tetratricopeptide repeat protein [Thermotomaculum hydrothermale]BBB33390.1 hypothetical protein TTHT_1939 [Thermotomaculum hydrothermale]
MKNNSLYSKKKYVLFLFFLVGILIYSPSLGGSFLFDDLRLINTAKEFKSISGYFKIIHNTKRFYPNRDSYAFWVLFLAEYNIFKDNPSGYKVVNLIFHILASFLFFLFLRKLLISKFLKGKEKLKKKEEQRKESFVELFSFLGGLLFLVHPVNTEAVSYVAGSNNGIGGFFFILGVYLFLIFLESKDLKNEILYFISSMFVFVVSFFFKEVYLVFPLFCVFLYLAVKPFSKKRLIIGIFAVLLFLIAIGLGTAFLNISPFPQVRRTFSKYSGKVEQKTIATNLYANAYAIYLNVFPKNINLDHDLPLIEKIYDYRAVLSFLFLLFLAIIFYKLRDKFPLSLFAYFSYLLLMAPSNSFILRGLKWTGYDILSERNLYGPAFFFTIIILEILWVLSGRDLKKFKLLATIVIVIFGIRTFARNFDYKDDLTIWKASLKYSPNRARPNFNYAVALKNRERFDEAIPYAKKAFKLAPAENSIGLLANLYKQTGKIESYKLLLESALSNRKYQTAGLYHQLGEFYYENGEFDKAEGYFLKAIKRKKVFVLPRLSLVYLYLNEGRYDKANRHLKVLNRLIKKNDGKLLAGVFIDNVVKSRVEFANALYNFGTGEINTAIEECNKAIKLNPLFTEPYLKLGEYYFVNNQDDKALFYFEKAKSTPDYPKYRNQIEDMINKILQSKNK